MLVFMALSRSKETWRGTRRCLAMLLVGAPVAVGAWGPHPIITQAALDVLPSNDPILLSLGAQAQRLTNYCWLADFKRVLFVEPDQDFYADDYLLFPQAPAHLDHLCPEVKKTYRPYFLRALQALRTETSLNAARWVGSLLHFVEDTGSPPHAAEIRGEVHSKMENWVNPAQIQIADYHARLLGTNDTSALEGFVRRMDELIEFSKPRGQRLVTNVVSGERAAVEPVVLECAQETSRVTADLLHTLGQLVTHSPSSPMAASLSGTVISMNAPAFEKLPARIVFLGTNISSLTDADNHFEFRNLSPGVHHLVLFRPGSTATNVTLVLRPGTNFVRLILPPVPANLVRNGELKLNWVRPDALDCWQRTNIGWEGELIPLMQGQSYRLTVKFKPAAIGEAFVRWTRQLPYTLPPGARPPKNESHPLTPDRDELLFTAKEEMSFMQIFVRTSQPLDIACESIRLLAVRGETER
jgi:hypothetical protein